MAYYVKGKTYTDHPLMDEICYNCKLILKSIVIKNDVLAIQKETKNSLENAEMFFLMHDKSYVDFDTFNFTKEIFEEFGYNSRLAKSYVNNRFLIPESERKDLTDFANDYFRKNFEEENDYYRMLNGLPPFGTGEEYYIWLTSSEIPTNYSKQVMLDVPLHLQPIELVNLLYENGTIDKLRKIYVGSNYSYMLYLGSRKIDLYTARKAAKWDILYMPNVYYLVRDKFIDFYKINRETYMTRSYQEFFSQSGEYYDQMMILIVLSETFANLITDTPQWYIRRDIFDLRSCKYFLEASGVEYFKIIPLKYQIRIVKNLNRLIRYKSSNKNIGDIINIFDNPNTKVYRYWLYKKIGTDNLIANDDHSDTDIKDIYEDRGYYNFGDIDENDETAKGDYDFGDLDEGVSFESVAKGDYNFDTMSRRPMDLTDNDDGVYNFGDIDDVFKDDGVYNFGDIDVGIGSAIGDYDFGNVDGEIDPDTVAKEDYDFDLLSLNPMDLYDEGVFNFGDIDKGDETAVGDYDFGNVDGEIDPDTVAEGDYDFEKISRFTIDQSYHGTAIGDYDFGDLIDGVDPDSVADGDYDFNVLKKADEYIHIDDPNDPDILPNGDRIDNKAYTLEFISSDYTESYDNYIKDTKYRTYYNDITLQDKYWDGEDTHPFVKNKILEQDFTIQGTKYMSVEYEISLREWLYQTEYMLGLILDSNLYESMSDVRIGIPSIDDNATFKLADLFLFLVIMSNSFYRNKLNSNETLIRVPDDLSEGVEPFIDEDHYDWKKKYLPEIYVQKNGRIHGFNSTLDKDSLIEVLETRHSHLRFGMPDQDGLNALTNEEYKVRADKWLEELGVFDYVVPNSGMTCIEDLVSVYEINTKVYEKVRKAIIYAHNQDDKKYLEYIYQELFTRPFDTGFYTRVDDEGNVKEYRDLISILQERDYILYDIFMSIISENNIDTKQDLMRNIMNDTVDTLEYYLSGDGLKYLYSFVTIESFGAMIRYIYLVVGFFKSYKVYLLDPYYTLQADDELENSVKPVDVINEYKIRNYKWDKAQPGDTIGEIRNVRSIKDLAETKMFEIADVFAYYDPDPLMDFNLDGVTAEKGEIEETTDIDCGKADPTSITHYTTFNGGKSYLGMVNMSDMNGGAAREYLANYYSINGGEAFDPDSNKTDAMGSQQFNYIIDGGAAGRNRFITSCIDLNLVGTELQADVIISQRKGNVIDIKPDGLYVSDLAFCRDYEFKGLTETMDSVLNSVLSDSGLALSDIEVLLNVEIRYNRIMGVLNPITADMEYVNAMIYNNTFIRNSNSYIDSISSYLNSKYNDEVINVFAWEEL